MKIQVIQLEPYDDTVSVRDRLSFVNTDRVLLVWPRTSPSSGTKYISPLLAGRKIDLIMIQRAAARQKARLALVTSDQDVITGAAELNISTFKSAEASYRARWKQPANKVFVDRSDRPKDAPDPYDLMLAASRFKRLTRAQRRTRRLVRTITTAVLAVTLLAVGYLILPGATVTITPAKDQISANVNLVADTSLVSVDVAGGRIPAAIKNIEIQTDASIATTGKTDVPNTLGSGTVLFANQTGTPVFIPAGTVVKTLGFKPARFQTTADATVDGGVGKTVSVPIEATQDNGGPAGNVEANLIISIEGTLADSLAVRNPEPTRGGSFRQQGVVTAADYDNLLVLAREKVRQDGLAEYRLELQGSEFVAPDSVRIIEERREWTTYSAFVGDAVDTLTLTLRVRMEAIIIDEQLARQAAFANLTAKVPAGRQLSSENVNYTRVAFDGVDSAGRIKLLLSASANMVVKVDAERIRQQIAGSSVNDAINTLELQWVLDGNNPPDIRVFPPFLKRLPLLPVRIDVRIVE